MSDADRVLYFEKHIDKLKKSDEAKKLLEEEQKATQENLDRNSLTITDDPDLPRSQAKNPSITPPSLTGTSSRDAANIFYFYNPTTVAFGKVEFRKKWGNRASSGNWRLSTTKTDVAIDNKDSSITPVTDAKVAEKENPQYTTSFYIEKLPKTQAEIDNISKERNLAYYQLGIIYKEKFKEYELASKKLEKLLVQNPEEKLVLPTMYNLYKIYQITDRAKAEDMKNRISSQYPNSRYAQIINNSNSNSESEIETAENEYNKYYKLYEEEQFTIVLEKMDGLIIRFFGDEIVPKFELLKANTVGKLLGLDAYKKALQNVFDNYPNSEEGKNAQEILITQIPLLEKMGFTTNDTKNWKILYKVAKRDDNNTKVLEEKIKKFITSENIAKLSYTFDIYNEKENFITISGIKSEVYAKNVAAIMKDDKIYKITEPAVVISNENYKVVQIKKNLAEYLVAPITTPVSDLQPISPDPSKQGMPPGITPPSEDPKKDIKGNPKPNSPRKK